MKNTFKTIAKAAKYVRVQRNVNQDVAAEESGVSLRSLQNIEAGNPVKSTSLLQYLDYLNLLQPMLDTLPDPDQLTPMELLTSAPKRRERARMKGGTLDSVHITHPEQDHTDNGFLWGDEK